MLVRTPLVEAEQDGSIRIQDLTKVVMARKRLGLAEERLVPFEAAGHVGYADDGPDAFHRISAYAPISRCATFVREGIEDLTSRRGMTKRPFSQGSVAEYTYDSDSPSAVMKS